MLLSSLLMQIAYIFCVRILRHFDITDGLLSSMFFLFTFGRCPVSSITHSALLYSFGQESSGTFGKRGLHLPSSKVEYTTVYSLTAKAFTVYILMRAFLLSFAFAISPPQTETACLGRGLHSRIAAISFQVPLNWKRSCSMLTLIKERVCAISLVHKMISTVTISTAHSEYKLVD